MTNFELKKKATEIIKRYFGMTVKAKEITLLEADGDGKYIFFAVGKSPVSYSYTTRLYNSFCVYPNWDGLNGMEMQWIEE